MPVTAMDHLRDQQFVALEQRSGLAEPPERLGMTGVTSRTAVHSEDVPQSVQFAMFAEEMLTAQKVRANVPDPHRVRLTAASSLLLQGIVAIRAATSVVRVTGQMRAVRPTPRSSAPRSYVLGPDGPFARVLGLVLGPNRRGALDRNSSLEEPALGGHGGYAMGIDFHSLHVVFAMFKKYRCSRFRY